MLSEKLEGENSSIYWYHISNYNWWRVIDAGNDDHIEYIRALYDEEIKRVDERFGSFCKEFMSSSLTEDTVVVFISTHGEEFMEHGFVSHASLYNENIHVPFMMYVPGYESKVYKQNVQGVDVMPSLLDILGIKGNYSVSGNSFEDVLRYKEEEKYKKRLILAENCDDVTVVIKDNWKLFLKEDDKGNITPYEMYNIESDSGEKDNVLFENYELVKELLREYKKKKLELKD